jgi:predicted DNA-binding protein
MQKHSLHLILTSDLRDRIRKIAKHLGSTSTQLAREALVRFVEESEMKFYEEAERKRRGREVGRKLKPLQPMVKSKLGPRPFGEREEETPAQLQQIDPTLDILYTEHAAKIARALASPLEKRIAVEEAVRAIKRYAPLTHPAEAEILGKLERTVVALLREHVRNQERMAESPNPPQQAFTLAEKLDKLNAQLGDSDDDLLGRPLNISKTATLGDIEK